MRILVDASPLYPVSDSLGPTGVGRWTVGVVSALAQMCPDWQITFVHFSRNASPVDVSSMGDNVDMRVLRRPKPVYRALRGTPLLPAIDRTMGPADVMLGAGYVPWKGRHIAEVPVVYDLSFMLYPQTVSRKHLYFLRWRLGAAIRKAPLVITISEAIKSEIAHHFGLDPARIRVVPPGCDPEDLTTSPTADLPALPESYFLFVGTVEPRKNLLGLLSAYRSLKAQEPESPPLVIAGGIGWRVADLVRELGRGEFARDVHALGYVSDQDLATLYGGALALVMPSHYEGFGIPALEAMATGCPTITSGRGGLAEVVGDASITVDPDDPADIMSAMRRVMSEPELRDELAARGRERATRFTWHASGAQLRDALMAATRG